MNKVKGFTLTEIIVASAIGSLVILAGLTLYYYAFKETVKVKGSVDASLTNMLIVEGLIDNFERCDKAEISNNTISFLSDKRLEYCFEQSNVIIQAEGYTDTIKTYVKQLTASMDSLIIFNGTINRFELHLLENGTETSYVFYKEYPAAILVERTSP